VAEGEYGGAAREYGRAKREYGRAEGEHGRAEGEHINETGVSAGAKRRHLSQQSVTCWPGFGETIYIYSILEFQITPGCLLVTVPPHRSRTKAHFVLLLPLCSPMLPLYSPVPPYSSSMILLCSLVLTLSHFLFFNYSLTHFFSMPP